MKKEKKEKKETSNNLKIILPVLCVAIVALVATIAVVLKDKNKEPEPVEDIKINVNGVKPVDATDDDGLSVGGVYDSLSFILDNVFEQTNINNIMNIKDALKLNGNILNIEKYRAEFAFQYGAEFGYGEYLGEEYTKETGAYSIHRDEYIGVYQTVYEEDFFLGDDLFDDVCYNKEVITEEVKCSDDPGATFYNSGIFTGYSETDEYRFKEIDKEMLGEDTYKSTAIIYDSKGNCEQEHDEEYCNNNLEEIGRIEIEYSIYNNRYIFSKISLFEK